VQRSADKINTNNFLLNQNFTEISSNPGSGYLTEPGIFFILKGSIQEGIKMGKEFSHFDKNGNAVMVDVSNKTPTFRTAAATGYIAVGSEIMAAVTEGNIKKGDVLGVARVAGIMGVKQTSSLIPMCHPLPIQKCTVDFQLDQENSRIHVYCTVKTEGKTGVEMEALTGVQVTLLTIYDMCKAIDKHMVMSEIHLVEKTGGKSGVFRFEEK
jgi:cyclic pyranopterin phosphate synthase